MTDEVVYSCSKCQRPIKAPRAQALLMLGKKKTRCQICGSALVFPPDVMEEFDGAHKVGGKDVRDEVSYGCEGCPGKSYRRKLGDLVEAIQKKKTTCPRCGKPFVFPPEVHESLQKLRDKGAVARDVEVDCPTCLRPVKGDARDPEQLLSCRWCGATMRAALDGSGHRPPPLPGPAATVEQVKAAFGNVAKSNELVPLVANALTARAARGEVAASEVTELASHVAALARWHPEESAIPYLPLPEREAEVLVPLILFPGMPSNRDRSSGVLELVLSAGTSTGLTKTGVANIIGLSAFFVTGTGFIVKGSAGENTREVQLRLRVSVIPRDGGVELALAHQSDDSRPSRGSAKEHKALCDRIVQVAPQIGNYYALLAAFGWWARGTPIVGATVPAITARLASLGEPLAARAGQLGERWKLQLK